MKSILIATAALAALATAAAAQTDMVNSYTAAELQKARAAATAAGFTPLTVTTAQAHNLFLKATRDGKTYVLTVTPDGHVYPSTPS
jgi:hypothetical protein